mmetsp:Transcript_42730/g.120662  ORF Transcript_42730/g.120662 Transcript_42730/m.120662 type:complete len:267 (+) Transcript_42730:3-803(+)
MQQVLNKEFALVLDASSVDLAILHRTEGWFELCNGRPMPLKEQFGTDMFEDFSFWLTGFLSHAAEGNSRFRSKGAKFQKMMWKPSDGPQVEGRLIVRLLTGADSLRFGVASMTPEGGRAGAHLVILSLENIKAVPSGPRKGSATALHTIVEDAANEDVATEDPDATDSVGESTGDGSFTEYKAWGVNSPPVSPGVATEFAMEPFALLDWNWAQSPSTSSLDSTDGLAPPPQRLRTRRRTAPVLPPRLRSIVRPTGLEVRKRIVMSL